MGWRADIKIAGMLGRFICLKCLFLKLGAKYLINSFEDYNPVVCTIDCLKYR